MEDAEVEIPAHTPEVDRRLVGLVVVLTLAVLAISALWASIYCRGLYQDGAYYLYRIAEREWFYLVDPARTTVQILRQAPAVLLSRVGEFSLVARGQALSAAMLLLPLLLTGLCWLIVPRGSRSFVLFPVAHLLLGFATMWMEAVGEAAIAAAYFWVLLFLLLFRTRDLLSQSLLVALLIPAFALHEGTCLLMPVLLAACMVRWRSARLPEERDFLLVCAVIVVCILVYQLRWMIHPRIPGEREGALWGLYTFSFLYADGHWNMPVILAGAGAAALAGLFALDGDDAASARRRRAIVAGFVLLALVVSPLPWLVERCASPFAQALSRYNSIFASLVLGGLAVLAVAVPISPARWARASSLAVIATLALAQASADLAMTARWRAYVLDLQGRLASTSGLIPWESTRATGYADRDANWRLMSIGWVLPIMSIVFAANGEVRAMLDYPSDVTFRPVDPARPDALPRLRGIDYSIYGSSRLGRSGT